MKHMLRIATNHRKLEIQVEDDAAAESLFLKLCCNLLNLQMGKQKKKLRSEQKLQEEPPIQIQSAEPIEHTRTEEVKRVTKPSMFYMRCKACGKEKAFTSKRELTEYHCTECGNIQPMDQLHRVFLYCECGQRLMYHTNVTDRLVEIDCPACGMPITAEQRKDGDYQSL